MTETQVGPFLGMRVLLDVSERLIRGGGFTITTLAAWLVRIEGEHLYYSYNSRHLGYETCPRIPVESVEKIRTFPTASQQKEASDQ